MKQTLSKYLLLIVSLVLISPGDCLAECQKRLFTRYPGIKENYEAHYASCFKFPPICECLEGFQKCFDELSIILRYELSYDEKVYDKFLHGFPAKENGDLILSKKTGIADIDEYIEFMNKNGLRINRSMDGLFIFSDPKYIVSNFRGILPDVILEYYLALNQDIEEGYESDAGFIIPWDTIRQKIIRYENFLKKVSIIDCYYLQRLAKEKIDLYLRSYLYGLDNSPALVEETNRLEPEAQKSIEKFLKENTNSKYYKIVKLFYEKAKSNKLRFKTPDPEIDGLLRKSRNYY